MLLIKNIYNKTFYNYVITSKFEDLKINLLVIDISSFGDYLIIFLIDFYVVNIRIFYFYYK